MAKKKKSTNTGDKQVELLQDLLIIELGKRGIPQQEIRKIIGVDIRRVNRIIKYFKK